MWDTFWGVRNEKNPFFFGQDRKSAFVDGYKFVRSRPSVLIIKLWWTRGVHPKIKGSQWAFDLTFSSGQNDHLVRAHQVFKRSTWFHRAVFARWTLSKSMGQNDPLIVTKNQVSIWITWFYLSSRPFFLSAAFCFSCSTACGNSMRSTVFSISSLRS